MTHLFSPITIANKRLLNRVVMGPDVSGYAVSDGFITHALRDYYLRRVQGGVGLLITEPVRVISPAPGETHNHLGLYADAFIPELRYLTREVHRKGACLIVTLDEPASAVQANLQALGEYFIRAAWRALAAECDGIMLSAADGGVLHALISPLLNRRLVGYGSSVAERLRLPLYIVEGIRAWMGTRLIIGFRLIAEDFTPEGITLHDARVMARRMTTTGVHILDITANPGSAQNPVACFPGWLVPLVENIKRVNPDTPVICSGLLGDPHLADSIIRDGSADLIMLGKALRTNPDWPRVAREALASKENH